MFIAMRLFWSVAAVELLIGLVPPLRVRQVLAAILITPVVLVGFAIFVLHPSLPSSMLFIMSAYRAVNLLRLVKARINEKYLRRSTLFTSLWVIGFQTLILSAWVLNGYIHMPTGQIWLVFGYIDIVSAAVLLISTVRHLWTTKAPNFAPRGVADSALPTLTVAIPARNETEDLEQCLASLVASNYPKLEILVLDDCSQNKRTPEIIRSFAHDGVRFLQGQMPADNWLAKNQAYQQLFEEANGELILFSGVDVRYGADSLRALVSALRQKNKTMLSIIPKNVIPAAFGVRASTLLQPMRYAWELALPRRLFRRPPVLSTCWLIRRELLVSAGGFAAVSRSIVPESYFARVSAVHDGYSFMQSSDQMGIISNKSAAEQRATTVRTRYPQVHRRIELVLILTLAELGGVLTPYVFLILGLLGYLSPELTIISIASVVLLTGAYIGVVALTYRAWLSRSLFTLPIATILDVVLLNYSMIRYEFFSVDWKGRNVCIPVMHVVEHLPRSTV